MRWPDRLSASPPHSWPTAPLPTAATLAFAVAGQARRTARQRPHRGGSWLHAGDQTPPQDPQPAVLHVDSCTRASRTTSPISVAQFRSVVRDTEYIETCSFCRPEDKLDDTSD
ncbi:DUF6233 domain-containing protein [Streptomyces sp. NPDC006333]|uniref:DUF6233 domain-containing protein n=1 Tax=Streptomyces sp. NPDC006333 TaxID=3156753 RepID=UPI0033A5FBBC